MMRWGRRGAVILAVIGCSTVAATPARAYDADTDVDFGGGATYVIQAHQPPGPGASLPPLYVGIGSANNRGEHRVWLLPGVIPAERPLVEWKIREQALPEIQVTRSGEHFDYYFEPASDYRAGGPPVRCLGENPAVSVYHPQNGAAMDLRGCPPFRFINDTAWILQNDSHAFRLGFSPARLSGGWPLLGAYGPTNPSGEHPLCLDVRGASYTPHAALQLWSCLTAWNQRFIIRRVYPGCSLRGERCLRPTG